MASESFALDLSKFAAQAKGNAQQVVRKVAIDVFSKVVLRTPVGNPGLWKSKPPKGYVGGRLRANWNASIGVPSFTVSQKIDSHGSATIASGTASISTADGTQPIYVMNSLPYVRRVEYGHSKQAPAGMVRVTVTEFQAFVDKAVAELPK